MQKQLGAIVLITALALTTACGAATASNSTPVAPATPASISANGAQQVTIEVANRPRFETSSIVVRAGQPVELTLRNVGQVPHDFTLSEGADQPVKIVANGGKTATGTFTFQTPGTYTFKCSVPGHEAAGMKGTIVAQ